MTMRRASQARRAWVAVMMTAGLMFTVTGCGGGGDDDTPDDSGSHTAPAESQGDDRGAPEQEPEKKVLAQVKGGADGSLLLSVTSVVRSAGGFLTVTGTLRNEGKSLAVVPGWQSDETELAENGLSMAGAMLTDQSAKKRYLILRDTEGRCLCTRFQGGFPQGESKQWFAQFPAPPASTTEVTFEVADLPPATIEIANE